MIKNAHKVSFSRGARRGVVPLLFFTLMALYTSCLPLTPNKQLGIQVKPSSYHINGVPFFPAYDKMCGPAALASVMAFYEMSVTPEEIANQVMLPDNSGTKIENLYLYAISKGMTAQMYSSGILDLKRKIAQGIPMIILINTGLPAFPHGHFVVVIGYDEGHFYLYDGDKKDVKVSRRYLYGSWYRTNFTSLLVLPPGTKPPPTSQELLAQALAHENKGEWIEAEKLYRLAIERDNPNIAAIVGVGNARLHLGDPAGAIAWYRIALRNDRHCISARINMAQALLEKGEINKAKRAIKKAIKLCHKNSSELVGYAYDTLGEILLAQGKTEEALQAYKLAFANLPKEDSAFERELLEKIKRLETAL